MSPHTYPIQKTKFKEKEKEKNATSHKGWVELEPFTRINICSYSVLKQFDN